GVLWIANVKIRGYSNPTEPNLYPHLYTKFIEHSAYAALERRLNEWDNSVYALREERDQLKESNRQAINEYALSQENVKRAYKERDKLAEKVRELEGECRPDCKALAKDVWANLESAKKNAQAWREQAEALAVVLGFYARALEEADY